MSGVARSRYFAMRYRTEWQNGTAKLASIPRPSYLHKWTGPPPEAMAAMDLSHTPQARPELSVVVPLCNEAGNIAALTARVVAAVSGCVASFELIFVDDGSRDGSLEAARALNRQDGRIRTLSFSRNFGKEIAIAAGLDHAQGDCVVIMDADLQHPPETIPAFVEQWRLGYKNVYGQRIDRANESAARRWFAERFYGIFESFGEIALPHGAGDFRLLDRQAVLALRSMHERARFSKGLYAWIGFKSVGVPYAVAGRASGSTKFSYRKLTRFALDGLMSFSTLPLKIWTYVGTFVSSFALTTAVYFLTVTAVYGVDVPGYASLIVSVLFFAGIQLMSLGILGEYIGRIFAEVKRRPLYLVAERIGIDTGVAFSDPIPIRHRSDV